MTSWLDIESIVLDEMVTLDGPGKNKLDICNSCGNSQTMLLYRCLECSYGLLYCRECIVKSHAMLPLHRLEVWLYFSSTTSMLIISSAGRMAFSTGPLSTRSDMSATLGTMATRVLRTPLVDNSPSSIPTAGTSYKSGIASAAQAVSLTNIIVNSSVCAGSLHPLSARKRLLPSTSLTHTTK
jgi:hypothetical protein